MRREDRRVSGCGAFVRTVGDRNYFCGEVAVHCGPCGEKSMEEYREHMYKVLPHLRPKPEAEACGCKPCETCGYKHFCNANQHHPAGWMRAGGCPAAHVYAATHDEGFLARSAAYAATCQRINELARKARAMVCTEAEQADWETNAPGTPDCMDRFNESHADDESPRKWWHATGDERDEFCEPCRVKVDLYRERHQLRRRAVGQKRSFLAAYLRAAKRASA